MRKKSEKKTEAGYSLIEVIVGAVLMLIVFTVFGSFLLRLTRNSAEIQETAKMAEDSGFSVGSLRTDLERTGRNFTVQDNQPFAGDTAPIPFFAHPDYLPLSSGILRETNTSLALIESALRFRGNSGIQFFGSNFIVGVREPVGSLTWEIDRVWNPSGLETVNVSENGVVRATITNTAALNVTSVDIKFSSALVGGVYRCVGNFFLGTRLIYQSVYTCTETYKQIFADMPVGNSIYDTRLSASEIVRLDADSDAVRLPLLPFYDGTRMTSPLVETTDGFVLLFGDTGKDAMTLAEEVEISPVLSSQPLVVDNADLIARGDVLFLVDFVNNRSCLLIVDARSGNIISITPVFSLGQIGRGFEKFYSDSSDFSGFKFGQGVRLVKLASPVEYRIARLVGSEQLYRRTEGAAWELILANVNNFSFLQNTQPTNTTFDVSFDVLSEGIETAGATQNVRLSINPRALNRTFDVR